MSEQKRSAGTANRGADEIVQFEIPDEEGVDWIIEDEGNGE